MIRLLIKLKDEHLNELHNPEKSKNFLYLDKRNDYFARGYVDANLPRSAPVTEAIMDGAESFAIWADGQGVIQTFDTFAAANAMFSGSRLEYVTQIKVEKDEPKRSKALESISATPI